jgi:hypothetical protein
MKILCFSLLGEKCGFEAFQEKEHLAKKQWVNPLMIYKSSEFTVKVHYSDFFPFFLK